MAIKKSKTYKEITITMNLQKQQTVEFDLHRQTRDIGISDTDYFFKYFM